MWSETPDLKDDHVSVSLEDRSTTFKNGFPVIDELVETPDLSAENADTGGIIFVHKGGDTIHLDPEMYNETPDLSSTIQ